MVRSFVRQSGCEGEYRSYIVKLFFLPFFEATLICKFKVLAVYEGL